MSKPGYQQSLYGTNNNNNDIGDPIIIHKDKDRERFKANEDDICDCIS